MATSSGVPGVMSGDLVTYTEAAAAIGVQRDTVARYAQRGLLVKYSKPLDRRVFVSLRQLRSLLDQEPTPAA